MNDLLLRLLGHMRWADSLVADALTAMRIKMPRGGSAVRPHRRQSSISGTRESTRVRLRWWCGPRSTVAEARDMATRHADLFDALVKEADEGALARRVAYRNSAGRAYESSVADIVTHVSMHGGYHRGQIARQLRSAGREPPYTDYIQFTRRDQ